MGFPSGYSEDLLPNFLMNTLSFLGLIRALILTLLRLMGLSHFLEPDSSWPEAGPEFRSVSASMIQELLPVIKFAEVGTRSGPDPPERCAVCLYDFQDHEEIRRLINCGHIFHKGCVDRWMEHDQKTCPLCRTPFIPDDMVWASPTIPEFGGEFTPIINTFFVAL